MSNSENLDEKITYQFDIIRRYDHYIGTANFKIGLLLSFLIVILVAIVVRAVSIATQVDQLSILAGLVTLVCALTVLGAATYLIRAVSPNINSASYRSYVFFVDVAAWKGGEQQYYSDFSGEDKQTLLKDICFQTSSVAKIATEKFWLISCATKVILFGVIPSFAVNILVLISGR